MTAQWTVLASGSAGNSSLLEVDGFGLLIDVGLGPRQLKTRLASAGASWQCVKTVLLTHTHGDHWNERALAHLFRQRILLYCHRSHIQTLRGAGRAFALLEAAKLVRSYEDDEYFDLTSSLRCHPLRLRHDGGPTFGFRFEAPATLFRREWSLGYATDLGCWDAKVARWLSDVDLLAIEFNHDVAMQRTSGRSPALIARVLGDEGHLSNDQAADLLEAIVMMSAPGRPRQVVQLHVSRQCNRPGLAAERGRAILARLGTEICLETASQDRPSASFALGSYLLDHGCAADQSAVA